MLKSDYLWCILIENERSKQRISLALMITDPPKGLALTTGNVHH